MPPGKPKAVRRTPHVMDEQPSRAQPNRLLSIGLMRLNRRTGCLRFVMLGPVRRKDLEWSLRVEGNEEHREVEEYSRSTCMVGIEYFIVKVSNI